MANEKKMKIVLEGQEVGVISMFDQTGRKMEETGQKSSGLGSVMTGVFQGMGMAIGNTLMDLGGKVASFATDSISQFEGLAVSTRKMERATGLGAEEASKLIEVAKDSGVGFDSLAQSLKIFDKNLIAGNVDGYNGALKTQAKDGQAASAAADALAKAQQRLGDVQLLQSQKAHLTTQDNIALRNASEAVATAQAKVNDQAAQAGPNFEKNGFAVRDAKGQLLPMTEVLGNVADKFKQLNDTGQGPAETALALKLFGKAGNDMLPVLIQGKAGISEITDSMDKYGLTLDEAGVNKGLAAAKSQRELGMAFDGLKVQVGEQLAPYMKMFTDWAKNEIPIAVGVAKGWLHDHADDFKRIGDKIHDAFTWAVEHVPLILLDIGLAAGWLKDHGIDPLVGTLQDMKDGWTNNIGTMDDTKRGMGVVGDKAGWLKDKVLDPLGGTLQDMQQGWLNNIGSMDDTKRGFGKVGDAGGWLKDKVLDPLWGSIEKGVQGTAQAFGVFFPATLGFFQHWLDVLSGIGDNSVFKFLTGSNGGGLGGFFKGTFGVPGHAAGGDVADGPFITGERGPELGFKAGNTTRIFSNTVSQQMVAQAGTAPGGGSVSHIRGGDLVVQGNVYGVRDMVALLDEWKRNGGTMPGEAA